MLYVLWLVFQKKIKLLWIVEDVMEGSELEEEQEGLCGEKIECLKGEKVVVDLMDEQEEGLKEDAREEKVWMTDVQAVEWVDE